MARSPVNPYHGGGGVALARFAAWVGVACPAAVVAVLGVAGWLSPAYDPFRTTLSHLGQRGQPFALEVNLSFGALGLTYVAVAWALWRSLGRPGRHGAVVLAVAGAALVGVAVISRDPTHPIPHRAVALVLFLALAVAPLLVAGPLRASPRWRRHGLLSVAVVAASFALLAIGVAGVVRGGLPAGAWERLYTAVNLAWLTALAAGLLRDGP